MACNMCSRNSHCHQSFNGIQSCDLHHYSDVPSDDVEIEPEAPTLSLGNRILWLTEARAASGIVKWIGRIPSISTSWTAGIEFDNVMPGGGNGDFRGRQYFQSRIGHSVFLPVSDLIKVDSDNSANANERTSFFGRLQDSCSNFAHRRRRDSTFGHFKQDFCSNCARNDFANYSHYCHNAPVYDRITTRRSMCYDDHAYEMFNPRLPCGLVPNVPNRFHHNNVSNRRIEDDPNEECLNDARIPALQVVDDDIEEYPDNSYARVNMMRVRRDSFFSPRSSISFINGFNGFKEWVTCLVLGTNRRQKKKKIVFKDKKSVTSVMFAQNSKALTGQRLSSFADYAAITVNRTDKQNAAITEIDNGREINHQVTDVKKTVNHSRRPSKYASDNKNEEKDIEYNDIKEKHSKSNTEAHKFHSKVKHKKKRPAPLPPTQIVGTSSSARKADESAMSVKHESMGTVKCVGVKEKETRYKVVRSSSIRIHAAPQRQRRKKRRAPPPPSVTVTLVAEDNNKNIPATKSVSVLSRDEEKNRKQSFKKSSKDLHKKDTSLTKPKSKKSKHKVIYQQVKKGRLVNGYTDSGEESSSESSKISNNSISFTEDESDDDKYGLVKYGILNKLNASAGSLNLPGSSNYIQYAGENSDVCLKISIQKTETNVVTVEEVSTPCSTTHYTIEDDSSSELSDEDDVSNRRIQAITYEEPTINSADTSSVSTIEENGDKSKTIFEELQMKPPAKGSVKDFVNAFNMLASKTAVAVPEPKKLSNNCFPKLTDKSNDIADTNNKTKESQSIPTKWEYQTKTPGLGYASNKFLLPIAEESHNETSEQDGNVSVDDSKSPSPKVKKTSKTSHTSKMSEINENSSKKCSHCSETHTQVSNDNIYSKVLKKRIPPLKDNIVYESINPFKSDISSQASKAALSSLLQEKQPTVVLEDKSKKSNSERKNSKQDQPIMVGLYIEDKSSHRGPIPLLVTPSMSLKKLKRQIEKEYEFPRHQQCWILGESFAVSDEASLASYGITEPGSPILLYVMAKDSKSQSLPSRTSSNIRANLLQDFSDSSEDEVNLKPKDCNHDSSVLKQNVLNIKYDSKKPASLLGAIPKTEKNIHIPTKAPPRTNSRKRSDGKQKKPKSEYHKAWEAEFEKKADYHTLLALDDVDLVSNVEKFECPVCFLDVDVGKGATLQECLHSFCKECLAGAIQFSENAVVKCPFMNDDYSCECHLQEREVKSLVTTEVYERHLQRSMALAESQAQDSFHCKTPDCPGWCLFEDNVNTFFCPVCKHTNCLTCAAIHEGKNCRQYQDDVAFRCDSSEEARKTKEYLQSMVDNGEAMRCPKCQVIMMKKWGCDWLKCSMCHTEVCWVTKGPRWGPGGRGDTSGGCKCMVNGARCHPKCSYCH